MKTRGGAERQQEIAELLRANLDRGFLESEERFRQITDALHDVVALSDSRFSRLFFVSAAYKQIWARDPDELYASPLTILEGVHPDDRERVRAVIVQEVESEWDTEFRVVRPDGGHRWVWMRGFPIHDVNGEIYRTAIIMQDITDRKQISESHERLVRGFTHDVKNPLGAVDGYLQLLELGVLGELTTMQMEGVTRARRSMRSALALVTQLLDIERLQAGHLRIERQAVNLAVAAREVVGEFGPAANVKHLSLDLVETEDGNGGPPVVETDRTLVRQILANLVSNAVKYTQPGGRVALRTQLAVDGEGPLSGRMAAISVADNGPGIPLEKQNLLFREFTRFTPDAAGGSGVGLAISQRLARALGATIVFRSAPGGGSIFTLWLPYDPPAAPAPELESSQPEQPGA